MSYKSILEDIKSNSLKPVYLCYGSEEYLKSVVLKAMLDKYINASFEDLNYVHMRENISPKDIVNACETLPFMSEKKVVVVEDYEAFTSKSKGDVSDELMNYIKSPNESTCVLFYCNVEKIDNRRKIVKEIKKSGAAIELNKISERELYSWIKKEFKGKKKKIDIGSIEYLVSQIGYFDKNLEKNMYDVKNEIVKISDYCYGKEEVLTSDIDQVITKSISNNIFALVDAIGQKNTAVCIQELNNIVANQEPIPKIMYMIIRQFRLLAEVKIFMAKGYNYADIAKEMKVQSFIVKKLTYQCAKFAKKELNDALIKCLETDKSIKTSMKSDRTAVEMLIIQLTTKNL